MQRPFSYTQYLPGIQVVENMLNQSKADKMRRRITDRTREQTYYHNASLDTTLDFGTTHVCVLAPNGDAVAATSSINR